MLQLKLYKGRWSDIMVGRALLFAGLVAVAGYVVVTVVGAEMIPGYNHLSHPLSEMTAQGRATKPALDRWFILLDTMVIGFASVMPASVCTQNDGVATYVQRGAAFLALAGVLSIIMTLWFPMDGSIVVTTVVGTLHEFIAAAIMVCSMLAILLFGFGLRNSSEWGGFAFYSFATFAFAVSCSIVTAHAFLLGTDLQGAWQRLTAGAILQWIFVVSLRALSAPMD
jgi:hypothetical protein